MAQLLVQRRPQQVNVQLGRLFDQLPPSDEAAEAACLGSLILDWRKVPDVESVGLTRDDFAKPAHGEIFDVCCRLFREHGEIDLVRLNTSLADRATLDAVGGVDYLLELAESVPSAASAEYYASSVRAHGTLRRLIERCGQAIHEAYHLDTTERDAVDGLIGRTQGALTELTRLATGRTATALETVTAAHAEIQSRAETKRAQGVLYGLSELDDATGGVRPGRPTVIAARPHIGKTALALNLLVNAAKRGEPCAMFSLEMTRQQLGERLLAMDAGVSLHAIRHAHGQWSLDDSRAMRESVPRYDVPLQFHFEPGITPSRLESEVRRLVIRDGVKLVVLDYLQLMGADEGMARMGGTEKTTYAMNRISRIGLELDIAVVVLSQLNRDGGAKGRQKDEIDPGIPNMESMRESGAIEQDAGTVIMCHHPDYYWGRAALSASDSRKRTTNRFIASVQKGAGGNGLVSLHFDGPRQRFDEWRPCIDGCTCIRCDTEQRRRGLAA